MLPENDNLYLKDKKTFDKISNKLIEKLNYTEKNNKQFVIAFLGVPCSGKTYISKKLEQRYKGIRIDSDEIMKINSQGNLVNNTRENEKLKNLYVYSFLKNPPVKNRLIILDKSIDREYENFFSVCKENNLEYFLIQIDLPKKEMINRIHERNPSNLENWLPRVNKWLKEHEECKENINPDIKVNDINPDLKKIFNSLDKKLS